MHRPRVSRTCPLPAVHAAKVFILDSLGVGIAGSSVDGATGLLATARTWGSNAEAQVWGRSARLSAPAAAFINAWQMHNQEFDCLHEGAVVHALATSLPAALAAGERRGGLDGKTLITAVAVGADIAAGLGLASRAGFRFFRPATAGGFGAVAAAACVLGLDQATVEAAFAWQLAQASGTMQAHVEGSPILPVQVAFNARAALQSCELAQLGFTPAQQVFEGPVQATCPCSKAITTSRRCSTNSVAPGGSNNSATSRSRPAEPRMAVSRASWHYATRMAFPRTTWRR